MNNTATKVGSLILGVALATGACGASGTTARQPSQPCNLANLDREIAQDGVMWDCERKAIKKRKRVKKTFGSGYTYKRVVTGYRYVWEVED